MRKTQQLTKAQHVQVHLQCIRLAKVFMHDALTRQQLKSNIKMEQDTNSLADSAQCNVYRTYAIERATMSECNRTVVIQKIIPQQNVRNSKCQNCYHDDSRSIFVPKKPLDSDENNC